MCRKTIWGIENHWVGLVILAWRTVVGSLSMVVIGWWLSVKMSEIPNLSCELIFLGFGLLVIETKMQVSCRKEQDRQLNLFIPIKCISEIYSRATERNGKVQIGSARTLHIPFTIQCLPSGFKIPLAKKVFLEKHFLFPVQSAFEIKEQVVDLRTVKDSVVPWV